MLRVVSGSAGLDTSATCHFLREDPELAEAIPLARRSEAIERCTVAELYIPEGRGDGRGLVPLPGGLGLLILEGLMIRRVGIDGRFGAELLGDGDLLRPWQDEHDSPMLALETGWSVVQPSRVALLDRAFVERCLTAFPELAAAVVARAMQRARNLAVNMAIVHQARVDVRLHMLLWHLAGRWGRVHSDATVLPLRLTHTLLADLVAARRPTVTSALSQLARKGLVRSADARWLLYGEAPGELLDVDTAAAGSSAAPQLASTP